MVFVLYRVSASKIRACSHGGGGPQADGIPHLGGVTTLSYKLSLIVGYSHMRSGVPQLSRLHGQPCRVTRLGGVHFPPVNV